MTHDDQDQPTATSGADREPEALQGPRSTDSETDRDAAPARKDGVGLVDDIPGSIRRSVHAVVRAVASILRRW